MNAIAILADVMDSGLAPDFKALRDRILETLSERHLTRDAIPAPWAVTAGDEFQGLVGRPGWLPRVVWDLQRFFGAEGLALKMGIGAGEVAIDRGLAGGINRTASGEAFIRARRALEAAADAEHRRGASRAPIRAEMGDGLVHETVNVVLQLEAVLAGDITHRQWQTIQAYEASASLESAAEALGVANSTVSRALLGARYWEIRTALDRLGRILELTSDTGS